MSEPVSRRLTGISAKAYQHPADAAATAALQSIPGLDAVVRKLIEFRYERAYRQALLAASVRIGPDQLPDVWDSYKGALDTLDMPGLYDLYLTQVPVANALAIGADKPMIVVFSGSLSLFEPDELETVLAHEIGHILSDHVLYQTALQVILRLVPLGRIPALAGLPLVAIRSALLEWSRAAELSSDRAATLVNRDPLITARTLMVLAGGVGSKRLNTDAFLRQGQDFHEWSSAWDRLSRLMAQLDLTHSYPVRRVAELMDWVRSGEYDRIIGGSYPRRDATPDPREHAGKAYDHYRERFRRTFEDAGESFDRAVDRMSEWLQVGANLKAMPEHAGQYVAYTFFRVDPAWRRLPVEERAAAKDAFAEVVEEHASRFEHLRTYSVTGVRPDADFFLWKISERYEDFGELGAALNATPLAGWLDTPYNYLATTRASQYTSARKPRKVVPKGNPYLVVYPFVKVRPWYSLSEEERQRAMDEHIRIGREEFPGIHNHTTYSFGIDDQEFMTAFECDEPADFMHLMLRLRDSEASRYTERDTPIFVGQHMPLREALDRLDGVAVREPSAARATS